MESFWRMSPSPRPPESIESTSPEVVTEESGGPPGWVEWDGPSLVTNSRGVTLQDLLAHELRYPELRGVDIVCSYILKSGIDYILPLLGALAARRPAVPIRVITTTQHRVTEIEAVQELDGLSNVTVKIVTSNSPSFHAKGWHFRRHCRTPAHGEDCSCREVTVIGSSNLSHAALTQGFEWNVRVQGDRAIQGDFHQTFGEYWAGGALPGLVAYEDSRHFEVMRDFCSTSTRARCGDPGCQQCRQHRQHVKTRDRRRTRRYSDMLEQEQGSYHGGTPVPSIRSNEPVPRRMADDLARSESPASYHEDDAGWASGGSARQAGEDEEEGVIDEAWREFLEGGSRLEQSPRTR